MSRDQRPPEPVVLVVEDELFIALELQDALVKGGFRVMSAATVLDALDLIDDERPDAAVLDVNLINETVAPVADQLKSLGVPFVLASASDPVDISGIPALADAVNLGKPTDLLALVNVLRSIHAAEIPPPDED